MISSRTDSSYSTPSTSRASSSPQAEGMSNSSRMVRISRLAERPAVFSMSPVRSSSFRSADTSFIRFCRKVLNRPRLTDPASSTV